MKDKDARKPVKKHVAHPPMTDSDRQAAREICKVCTLRYDEHDGRELHRFEAI